MRHLFFTHLISMKNWNYKTAKAESLKHKNISMWKILSPSSYKYTLKNGLVEQFSNHMNSRKFLTYDLVKQEALKYNSKRDWQVFSISSYQYAVRHKLLEEFSKHMKNPRIIWNYETVKKEALKYKTKVEWIFYSRGSYTWASNKKQIPEFSKHMIPFADLNPKPKLIKPSNSKDKKEIPKLKRTKILWNYESARKEALKYTKKSHWKAHSSGSYKYACKNNLIKKLTKHMQIIRNNYTLKDCIKFAKKYKKLSEWREKHHKSYSKAYKSGWIYICGKHFPINKGKEYWKKNPKKLILEMKKYSTRREFAKTNPTAYLAALTFYKAKLYKIFPIKNERSSSLGEKTTRLFLSKIFQKKFIKGRHEFLKNPKTGHQLELDGYCKELKIAFEYGDHTSNIFKQNSDKLKQIKFKDKFKIKKCKENGIILLQIKKDSFSYVNPLDHLRKQIYKELLKYNLVPDSFDKIPIKVCQLKNNEITKEKVWKCVKKSKNINELQRKYVSIYSAAVRLGIVDQVRAYYQKKGTYRGPKKFIQ